MIRVLLSLLLLEVCVGRASIENSNPWASGRSLSSNEHSERVVRSVAEQKPFGDKGNYVCTVISVSVPHFSDSIDVGFVSEKADKFEILFEHISFSKLSSAYALAFQIDLDAKAVQLSLRLGKAHINGTYCLSTPSAPSTAYDGFELNMYANLIYTHQIPFHVDENDKPIFGKPEHPHLFYKKVKGHYANAPKVLTEDAEIYQSPKLFDAVVDKIFEEVRAKVSLDEVAFQIKNEIAFRYRNQTADRFKKAIADAFQDVHDVTCFIVYYVDQTNFARIIRNFEVRIPTFVLRDVEKFVVHDLKISFAGDNVHAKVVFRIASSLAVMDVVYRDRNDPHAPNQTVKAEYQMFDSFYEFELIAKLKTRTVEVANVAVHVLGVTVAPTQGLYGDARDLIIQQLVECIPSYYPDNGYHGFGTYVKGLVAEGRIAHDVFK